MTWRATARDDLPLAALWSLGSLCALAMAPLVPLLSRLTGPCPFHALTGLPCLTCGTTRAALALVRGDLATALTFNPLAASAMVTGALGGFVAPGWVALRWPVPRAGGSRSARVAIALALAANWGYVLGRR